MSGVVATVIGADWDANGEFLSRYTVNKLGRVGSQVIVPYRGCELGVRHLRVMGDLGQMHFPEYHLMNEKSVAESVKYSNVVINMAMQDYKSRHFSMSDANVDGARIVARAAAEAGASRLIHVSALGADPDSESEYLRTKAAGEVAVREEFPDAIILRPAVMIGDEDNFLNRLAHIQQLPGPFPLTNMGETIKQPVYVGDVAQAIMNAMSDPAAPGTTYELVGPKAYTMAELCDYVGETTRQQMWTIGLPEEASPLVKMPFSIASAFRLASLPNTTEFYRYSLSEAVTKGAPGFAELGIEPATLERIGIRVLRRYRSHIYHDDIVEER